jgi:hypothetical protein
MKKVSMDDAIPSEDRIALLAETILKMAQALHFFTPEGSRGARTAINTIQLDESMQL